MCPSDANSEATLPTPSSPRVFAGVRRSAWLELAAFFAASLAFDHFLLEGRCFPGISPHPFWAVILIMAVQYGTGEALLAAAVSTAAVLLLQPAPVHISIDRYAALLERLRLPGWWMLAAVVLGEIRRRHADREKGLLEALARSGEKERFLRDAAHELDASRRSLEIELAGLPTTLLGVCLAAPDLHAARMEWIPREALRLVAAALCPVQCSVFLKFGTEWRLTENAGWRDDASWARVFPHTHPLIAGFEAGEPVFSVLETRGQHALAGEGLAAAALRNSRTGLLVGMIKIESWERAGLHSGNLRILGAIAAWVASAWTAAQVIGDPAAHPAEIHGGYGGV